MAGEGELLLMVAGVHLLGLACALVLIIPALRDAPDSPPWSREEGSDDDWRRGPREPPKPPPSPRGGIPLPDAEQGRMRLRDHGRLADDYAPHERRPAREPGRTPVRAGHW